MKGEVISDRTWNGDQSWYREIIESIDGTRLRFKVRVNAYDFQSYGKAQVWRDGKWHEVHTIPGQQLKSSKTVSYVDRHVRPNQFDDDIVELRRVAKAVIG